MSSGLVLGLLLGYFALLLLIAHFTSRKATTTAFFTANRSAPWYLVAFGMIGASLSGVTFISVPGAVRNDSFSYFQMVLGYLPGYAVIAGVLLPLYYRLNLISIYGYLEQRFGYWSYKTGAFFFLLSRSFGSAIRLFLAASVLHIGIFEAWNIPFALTVVLTIVLIWLYTFRGGIKTIVWTDTLQTFFMLFAVLATILMICRELQWGWQELQEAVGAHAYSQVFFWEVNDKKFFWKQFLAGMFTAIAMTGLDQDMMQKNLTCRSLKEAQKNMFSFSIVLVFVNLFFLLLGVLLYVYAVQKQIALPERGDHLYPLLAFQYFPPWLGAIFVVGVIAAAYSSADSSLTALTTSFCVDFLDSERRTPEVRDRMRRLTHIGFSALFVVIILFFQALNSQAVISAVFTIAGYTYGPLLGLYAFGLFTKIPVKDRFVPLICLASPLLCYLLSRYSKTLLGGYELGFELLIINGLITFLGLWLCRKAERQTV